jgi:integrase
MFAADEVQSILDRLQFRKRHTDECQTKNNLNEWQPLDNRKRCNCPYWSCGVHDRQEGFQRRSTAETSVDRAREVVRLRLESGNRRATLPDHGTPIKDAISDFIQFTKDGGAEQSTLAKYQTLMDQLQAFADWKGYRYLHELDRDAVEEFRRSWEDPTAGYKQNRLNRYGRPLWRKQSIGTCRRSKKTLSYFFQRAISRQWLSEDPTVILRFPKEHVTKHKEEVKYLRPDQFSAVLAQCDHFKRVTDYNKIRIKALILTMRWTGLRISDAVILKAESIAGDVLRVRTKKSSTAVQIPLPPELLAVLSNLQPYDGGYYFWNKRTNGSKPSTAQGNFGVRMAAIFKDAGIDTDAHHVSHMLRNTFAVDYLEKGIPLETVSLLLGHQSVTTTEKYYADFSKGYMDKIEAKVRETWTLAKGQQLD